MISTKMKKAVVTVCIGDVYSNIARLTHPTLKAYADRVGADFVVLNSKKTAKSTPHWEKFAIRDLFKNGYDRIIYVDTDIIIRDDCPNLFEEVPAGMVGMFDEAPFTDRSKELMIDTCKEYGITLPGWNSKYYNTGVMVLSKVHEDLLEKPEKEYFSFYEQTYINVKIAEKSIPVHDLSYKFNRMVCMDGHTGEDRYDSYIIHYAGFPNYSTLNGVISKDIKMWATDKKNGYKYKRHIHIKVSGGLGDQAQAEPPIRYMIEKLCKGDDFVITTHWPRLFEHLNVPVYEHGKGVFKPDTPYITINTLPGPDTINYKIVSNLLCHTVDYVSMALMKRILLNEQKVMKFGATDKDREVLKSLVGDTDLSQYVAIHPGRHWENKTFPKSWWDSMINELINAGLKVCVIGKTEDGDTRGLVNVDKSKCLDLTDKLPIGPLLALYERVGGLLTNDSGPMHLAGASKTWIFLVPTCKRPEHLFPYRGDDHISNEYKSMSFCKKLVLDDIGSDPLSLSPIDGSGLPGKWDEYLPDTKEVAREIAFQLKD